MAKFTASKRERGKVGGAGRAGVVVAGRGMVEMIEELGWTERNRYSSAESAQRFEYTI